MLSEKIPAIQEALARDGLDGWLFRCFQTSDPVSQELLGIPESVLVSRRCYYLVPRRGEPRKLVHVLEPAHLDALPGAKASYMTWKEHREGLAALVAGCTRLAAQYSPGCALPTISRLDAGTVELLREAGAEPVSSAELVQEFAAVWSAEQLEGHRRASTHLHEIARQAFDLVAAALGEGRSLDERSVQRFILEQFERRGLATESDPIVAVDAHAADPHYAPPAEGSAVIRRGQLLLIDLWAKETAPASVYADITWCATCDAAPSDRQQELFSLAVGARDAALELVRSRWPGEEIRGYEVDDAARRVIDEGGYGESFIHRTGHSIGIQDHGQGANMDNLETHDQRRLRAMTGFSIEPGIYLPGEIGVRTEINVALTADAVEVTGAEPQAELVRLLA